MKKLITLILIISYVITCNRSCYGFGAQTLFTRKSHAQRHVEDTIGQEKSDILHLPSSLNIPKSLGRIVEYHKGKNEKLVIHIQDRHIDPVTQNNIASIIKVLNVEHNIYLMCLEGASKELDTSFYNSFEDTALKKKIAEVFVQQGLFTGPELYKITNADNYMRAVGAEDSTLYLRHLASYKDNQINKDEFIKLLKRMDTAADALKKYAYSEELLALDKISLAYTNKQLDLPEYLTQLKEYAAKANISLEEYPNLNKFICLMEKESKIDFKAAKEERESLIRYFSEHLPKEEVQELVQLSLDFRLNKVSDIMFHEYLERLINDSGLSNKDYLNLAAYIDYIRFSKAINHLQVFDEAQDLDKRAQLALCDNVTQEKIVEYAQSISMLEGLYNLKLTHRNLDYMQEHPGFFDILKIASFLQRASLTYGLDVTMPVASLAANKKSLKASRRFYKLALRRDIALTNNTLRHMTRYKKDKAVLVTGGFHTQGITNILKEKDISYVVICPTIGLEDCEKIYEERINGILPDIEALKASLVNMLSVPLGTGDITGGGLSKDIQKRFAEVYDFATVKSLSAKASSVGRNIMIGTQALILAAMLTVGVVAYKDWFNSSETAREAFVIEHEIPSGQWQIILNSLREFYNLIEDIDAPQLHSTELKFKIGKTARIIRDYITKNIDIIYKYSQEQNIDPAFLAAIVVTEQMDLTEYSLIRNRATDRIGPYAGHDSSRGPGQITDEAFKEFCAGIRWPYYGNKLTKELSWLQRHDILQGEGDNIDSHIQAIAAILRGKRNLINDNAVIDLSPFQADLQLAQSYTSRSIRGPVPEETRNLCKMTQLRESETLRMQIYAHWVLIHRDLIKKLSFYYGYPHVFDKSFLQKSSSAGQSLNVRQGESLSLADQSPDRLQALLGVSIAVAAFNQKTEESRLSHFFPVVPMTDLSDSDVVKWKQSYMKRLIGDIKGDEWNVAVIGSDTDLEGVSEDFKLTPEDLYGYLKKQEVNNIHLDPIFTTKIVYLNSPGKVTIILNAYGDIQYPIDLSTQKPFLDGGITVADIVKNIVLQGNQTSAFVFSWLNIERIHELEQIIEGLDREDALLSADARFNMAYILADFVIRKALAGADHLRSLDMSYKTSSSGIRVLNEELYVNIGKAMDKNIKPLYDPLSYLGLGRVTFITNARSFTEVDREHLRRLAMQNAGLSNDDPKKITIVAVYDEAKSVLKESGFTDIGDRPSVLSVSDFSFLANSLHKDWASVSQAQQIAMIAASIRGQNRAVITITDDKIAGGISSTIPAYLQDRKKGKIVIASMKGAEQKTQIGDDIIEEDGIFFSAILANAVKEIAMQFIANTDQQLFILDILPPINSKAFEEFIHNLTDIRTAIQATASAA